MRKLVSLALAILLVLSMTVIASAESTTTLTTTVPAASYTLNIPADQVIDFGATSTNIGSISVTDANGFAVGKNLNVTLKYDAFTCEDNTTTIPLTITLQGKDTINTDRIKTMDVPSNGTISFLGKTDGTVEEYVYVSESVQSASYAYEMSDTYVRISSEDWGKALAGTYTSTVTFTAEVVAE